MSDQPKVLNPNCFRVTTFPTWRTGWTSRLLSSVWHPLALSQLGRMAKMPSDSVRRLGAAWCVSVSWIAALSTIWIPQCSWPSKHCRCFEVPKMIGPYNSETARISPNRRLFVPPTGGEEHLRQGFFDDGDAVDSEEGSWRSWQEKNWCAKIHWESSPKWVCLKIWYIHVDSQWNSHFS